jgi:type II secretory pathway pseudopilin PulG
MTRTSLLMARHQRGVTLVELIIFIAIVGFVAAAMVQGFTGTTRGSHYGKQLTQASQLAQQRMEVILSRRKQLGYGSFDANTFDPCDNVGAPAWTAQVCQSTTGYTVASTGSFASDACGAGTGTDCRLITVTVNGPSGDLLASLTQQVWNY